MHKLVEVYIGFDFSSVNRKYFESIMRKNGTITDDFNQKLT